MRSGLFFLLLILVSSCKSQPNRIHIDGTAKKNLETQLAEMTDAFVSSNYEKLLQFTYPRLVEIAGGPEQTIKTLKADVENLKKEGITFDSLMTGLPSNFVQAGQEIHTLIPETIFLNVPRGLLKSESYLIAISQDKGISWYFIDVAGIDSSNIKTILPNYNFELKIPPKKDPVLVKTN